MSSSPKSDVFCITNKKGNLLHPAIQSTILAKYSRSSQSARDIILNLTSEDANKFQERWVGKYGHDSVAELANIPICFENVSIIASKFIESWQRAGYSEKSTRYQIFNRDSFVTPDGASFTMKNFAFRLYDTYENLLPKMIDRVSKITGEDPRKLTVKARSFDNVRYLLPAGTGTNVAAVLNIRDMIDMIKSMTGHGNPEFRELGRKLHDVANEFCPALLKHISPNNFQMQLKHVEKIGYETQLKKNEQYVILDRPYLMPDPDLEQSSFKSLVEQRYDMSWEAFTKYMDCRPEHCEVPDPFKTVSISFEIMTDYGAFRDLQRHRRCEQYVEPLRIDYGYVIPDDIIDSPFESEYRDSMESIEAYDDDDVVTDEHLMQYMIPLGYLHKSIFQMDLKELYYIIELRTKTSGHISYRRIAHMMYEIAIDRWPLLMQWCRVHDVDEIGEHN